MDTKHSLRTLFTIILVLFSCEKQLVSSETTAPTTCRQSKLSDWHNIIIIKNFVLENFVLGPAVYLKSKYRFYYNNNSMIPISDIGEGADALLCITDLRECCKNNQTLSGFRALGDWCDPSGSASDFYSYYRGFYKNRDRSVVRLHRREDTTAPTGQFCCKVPNAAYKTVTIRIDVIMSNSSESENISSPTLASGNEYCEQTSASTASQQPITSIPLTIEG